MKVFKHITELKLFIEFEKKKGKLIGFVPTMGALHNGHISLIDNSKQKTDFTVCSIFVNPTQFNNKEDFEKYPITITKDVELLEAANCDVLFLPSASEIYPFGLKADKHYELGYLETVLDGAFRLGHFQGVCQVVERLLQIVEPNHLFLGQKDYQQCMVITKLVELMNKQNQITINICDTLREADGLAMSSRNMRLSNNERNKAIGIYQTMLFVKKSIKQGNIASLKNEALELLIQKGFKPDYIEVADANTLELLNNWDGETKLVVLVAAFMGNVRLIDNMPIN